MRQFTRRHRAPGSRASRACVNCKERKLKCDELSPTCSPCSRSNLTCLVEDPDTKKHRPRNYLTILEQRLAVLEREKSQEVGPDERSSPAQTSLNSTRSMLSIAPDDKDEEMNDLPTGVGLLDVRFNQAESQYLGSSSAFAFSHVINASLRGATLRRSSRRHEPARTTGNTPVPCLLPEYNIAISLSNAYFENIHPQYPFLHEPTFRRHEEIVLSPSSEDTSLSDYSISAFFVNMVYSVGALLVPGYQHMSEQLYLSAQLYPEVLSLENLESIQAILCYAMYSLRSAKGPSLWKLSGLALRQCIELGYHRGTGRFGFNKDPLHKELRKRAFWCSQGIDVTSALFLGRPLGIQLYEIDVELPLDIDDSSITPSGIHGTSRTSNSEAATSMSNAIHVIRLRQMWARIHTSIYANSVSYNTDLPNFQNSATEKLRADLEEWLNTAPQLPTRVGKTLSIFSTRDWYKLNHSGTILHLYRTQLAENQKAPDSVFVDCMHAAENVCRSYRRLYVGTSVKHTWGTLHCLFLAGLIYLHCLWSSTTACDSVTHSDVNKTCTDCTMVLVVIAEDWEEAAPYRDIFEVLSSRTIAMVIDRTIRQPPVPVTPALSSQSDREAVSKWMADIDGMSMLSGFDDLLAGFMDSYPPYITDDTAFSTSGYAQ